MKRYLASVFILAGVIFPEASSVLTAEYLDVKLPSPNHGQVPYYDGNDKIYLFGGSEIGSLNKILSFSISSETVQELGVFPDVAYKGSVQPDSRGNFFYFGGGWDFKKVYKYDPKTNVSTQVATLPYSTYESKSVKPNATSNMVYILGGREDTILGFDMVTNTSSVVSILPSKLFLRTLDRIGKKAYGFAFLNKRALELDLQSLKMTDVGPPTLPNFSDLLVSVVNGRFIYLIGGYSLKNGVDTSIVIQFNSETFLSKFRPLSGLRLQDANKFSDAPASVYVPHLNRIYCFGGDSIGEIGRTYDDIFYIDIDLDQDSWVLFSGASVSSSQFGLLLLVNLFMFSYQFL